MTCVTLDRIEARLKAVVVSAYQQGREQKGRGEALVRVVESAARGEALRLPYADDEAYVDLYDTLRKLFRDVG